MSSSTTEKGALLVMPVVRGKVVTVSGDEEVIQTVCM